MSGRNGHQKDIEKLNFQYLSMIKQDIEDGGSSLSSLVQSIRGGSRIFREADDGDLQMFSATNAFQYKLVPSDKKTTTNNQEKYKLLAGTLHLYREIISSAPHVAESITGLSSDEVEFLASLSKEEIDDLAQKQSHEILMRFAANYWKKLSDVANDGREILNLVTAAQAANEIYNKRGKK